ncbi:UDP-3-O-(3-hydroxymyristoyl)glucosamine N-acyltransferase [Pseudooceanicola sp.]|uniref:UDP-3-O-(3-hydroxymyristoyl)glucosamine N-acyltransferase n=1 Tax=Pseudooceanicola sp. TaxID=1914328 RepID=UPI00262056DE|nr:UDP-3-O-(3-hydroxymyristoyl)glucosamine N-acyltransferase [Pseudooceanicola sp.]MDF1855788.1 UDP-3-O-(3-hydroxymyristoyl)glucosamine N-acyltransferase [Pseudooceanicola sp.]
MSHSIAEIAAALGAEAVGDTALRISRAAEPALAGPQDLALALKPEFAAGLLHSNAQAALIAAGMDWQALGLAAAIIAPRGRLAMAGVTRMLDPGQGYGPGRHPSAAIAGSARLGRDVQIGAFAVIGAATVIGDGAVIGPGCYIGPDVEIGARALLHAQVRIGRNVRIGSGFIAQPGVTIGFDGASYVTETASNAEQARASLGEVAAPRVQAWQRIHSLGSVVIGDDVELGANTCVDAGSVRPTRIGSGTKIDNLCHIAHNVVIGEHCFFAAMVGIAGSAVIGTHVVLGGQAGVSDNVSVGDNVVAAGGTGILSNVPAGRVMMGYPAVRMAAHLESYKALRRLPRLAQQLAEIKNLVFKNPANH